MRKDSCLCFVSRRSLPTPASLTDEQVRVDTTSHLRRNGRKGLSFLQKLSSRTCNGLIMCPQIHEKHFKILVTFINQLMHLIVTVVDYILITNLMYCLLFIRKILFSSTRFEPQVLIFRRIELYTCSIWYCHSLWEFVVACRYTAWVRTHSHFTVVKYLNWCASQRWYWSFPSIGIWHYIGTDVSEERIASTFTSVKGLFSRYTRLHIPEHGQQILKSAYVRKMHAGTQVLSNVMTNNICSFKAKGDIRSFPGLWT